MLLNLSNHPASAWSTAQLIVAQSTYGDIYDLAFPAIDPNWSVADVTQLAETYYNEIINMTPIPQAVHLMGEMTFSFALINLLRAKGIVCVASTARRQSIDKGEGRKEIVFEFVQFRAYY